MPAITRSASLTCLNQRLGHGSEAGSVDGTSPFVVEGDEVICLTVAGITFTYPDVEQLDRNPAKSLLMKLMAPHLVLKTIRFDALGASALNFDS